MGLGGVVGWPQYKPTTGGRLNLASRPWLALKPLSLIGFDRCLGQHQRLVVPQHEMPCSNSSRVTAQGPFDAAVVEGEQRKALQQECST
jgi:hypothetical protein